jgi:hypothetical protein
MSTARFSRSAVPARLRSRVVSAALAALLPAAMLVAGAAFGATSAKADPPPTDPPPAGYDPATSVAVSRTAQETDYQNADGSMSAQLSGGPLNYQASDGAWHAIDNSVQPDPAQPGGYRNAANDWRVHFGSTTQGVVVDTDDGSLGMTPVGASNLAPATTSASSVTYPNAWPNVDLTYKVTPEGVKESVLLKNRSAATHFSFAVRSGTAAEVLAERGADNTVLTQQADGSVTPAGDLGDAVTLGAPTVLRADGAPVDGAGATLTATTGHATLALDPAWLAAQPDSAFPINLDPVVQTGYDTIESFKNDGTTCSGSGCVGVQFGNSNEPVGARYWRTVAHFPYSSLFGDKVLSAKVGFAFEGGSHNAYPVHVHWASSYSYDGAAGHPEILVSANPGDTSTTFYGGTALTNQVESWIESGSPSAALGFIGSEQTGVYTYQVYNVALWIDYDQPPNAPYDLSFDIPHKSCAGRQLIDGTKSFKLQAKVSDPQLEEKMRATFEIWNGQHTQMIKPAATTTGYVGNYLYQKATYRPYTLRDGYAFDWRVQARDRWDLPGPHSDFCGGYIYYPKPKTPTGLAITSPKPGACVTGSPYPAMKGTQAIAFKGVLADPDGRPVQGEVQVVKTNDSSTQYYTAKTLKVSPASGGTPVYWSMPANKVPDKAAFSWRMRAVTAVTGQTPLASEWSAWCHGQIDDEGPDMPSVSSDGPDPDDDDDPIYLGVGWHLTFSDSDVVAYSYRFTDGPFPLAMPRCGSTTSDGVVTVCATNGKATAAAPPTNSTDVAVNFIAWDSAGNASEVATRSHFPITSGAVTHGWATGTKVIGQDDSDPSTLADWDGANPPMPLTVSAPGTGWVDDGVDDGPGLHFDGTNDATTTTAPIDTANSFGVAAWVRPDGATSAEQVAVSQTDGSGSATTLGLDASGRPQFCVETAPSTGGTFDGDCVTAGSAIDSQWHLVAGSWNARNGTLRLFVDGTFAGTVAHASTPGTSGGFVIGHSVTSGAASSSWHGDVADIAVYDDVLAEDQVAQFQSCGLVDIDANAGCADPSS